jgi:alkanesulfonate monooxygenase SsuD/methylene tetrahydromethanopterin reductase-like flavin-dependent oxidoreductase (luciferase family)
MRRPVAFGLNVDPNTGGLAIDIVRATWTGQPFGFAGKHYQIPQAQPGPRPAHEIGIWLGVTGPRAVRLAGAKADGWSVSAPYVPLEQLRSLNNILTASPRRRAVIQSGSSASTT